MFTRNTSIQRRTPLLFTFLLRWSRLYYNRFIVLHNEQSVVFSGLYSIIKFPRSRNTENTPYSYEVWTSRK